MTAANSKQIVIKMILISALSVSVNAQAALLHDLQRLQHAYPNHIQSVTEQEIIWKDGAHMRVNEAQIHSPHNKFSASSLREQIENVHYPAGKPPHPEIFQPTDDPGRIRYEPFFEKMYGTSKEMVEKNLVTIYWMPRVFGQRYPLKVTKINAIDKKLIEISNELEKFPASYHKYLIPQGAFDWRDIAYSDRRSTHSFGMTLDLSKADADYWQWDLAKAKQPINEHALLHYHNRMPWDVVLIFEKYGFIWGGKWYHYDTMHFEYRPELLIRNEKGDIRVCLQLECVSEK